MTCPHCHSSNLVAHTSTAAGSPRYRCKDCGKAFVPKSERKKAGPKPIYGEPLSDAEKMRRVRQKKRKGESCE